jgi:hypothetical protein
MAGMVQIITYLLCVYLVFKGVEILQISLANTNERWARFSINIGVAAVLVSIVLAFAFIYWIDSQAQSLSDSMMRSVPGLPTR